MRARVALLALASLSVACGDPGPADPRQAALAAVKSALTADLASLVASARALQSAAPAPDADGWSAARDPGLRRRPSLTVARDPGGL